jgi:outer membrane biosynthesis protein TonB
MEQVFLAVLFVLIVAAVAYSFRKRLEDVVDEVAEKPADPVAKVEPVEPVAVQEPASAVRKAKAPKAVKKPSKKAAKKPNKKPRNRREF